MFLIIKNIYLLDDDLFGRYDFNLFNSYSCNLVFNYLFLLGNLTIST